MSNNECDAYLTASGACVLFEVSTAILVLITRCQALEKPPSAGARPVVPPSPSTPQTPEDPGWGRVHARNTLGRCAQTPPQGPSKNGRDKAGVGVQVFLVPDCLPAAPHIRDIVSVPSFLLNHLRDCLSHGLPRPKIRDQQQAPLAGTGCLACELLCAPLCEPTGAESVACSRQGHGACLAAA